MATIQLGFKAFDAHELLCHFVAEDSGLYQRENIAVELLDITFSNDAELPAQVFQASCGAALSSALQGSTQRVLFVATDKPMFWLYGKAGISQLSQLRGTRIATFPAIAPPHHLANIILKKSALDVEQDLRLLPARDDVARLGLLKSGSAEAAVISSAIAPAKIQALGMNKLCFFGDELRIPTTGLAVAQSYCEQEAALTQTLVAILRDSLSIIATKPKLVADVLEKYFDVAAADKLQTAELFSHYYTRDGTTTVEIAQNAIKALCQSLGLNKVPDWQDIYRFNR